MRAKDISGQAPGGKRSKLAEVLPLSTPFVVQIFPVYSCNFRCKYCIFSIDKVERGFISDTVTMDLRLYKRCVDDMAGFPDKVKVVRFVGIGEPLLHKNLAEMIAYTAEKKVAGKIELLTNASLLTPGISDALLASGLSRLVVSLQGTGREKYLDVCGAKIDFEKFVANLAYFYEHKGACEVYVKIVDSALDGDEDKKKFFELFGDVCDTMAVEHTVPIHHNVDYNKVVKGASGVTQFGLPVSEVKVCPQPFFTMQINPDGKVVPCYSFEYPGIMGDCNTQTVVAVWNGEAFRNFRRAMLNGAKVTSKVCADCSIVKYRLFPEDDLSGDVERLRQHFR